MTTPELDALARRAVACRRWRWVPGMLAVSGGRIIARDDDGYTVAYIRGGITYVVSPDDTPDPSDHATVGCLLALVREAWSDPRAHVGCSLGDWVVWATPADRRAAYAHGVGDTETGALVAALEAAP